MGIPTNGTVVDSQSYILRDIAELYKDKIELVYPKEGVRRIFHDFARNMVVEEFLASDCDVLWFLDSDVTPSKYVMDLVALHYAKWDIAGATYPVFMIPPTSEICEVVMTTYRKNPESGNYTLGKVPTSGEEFVDGLATGCLFIKRAVLEKLSKPYFEFKFDSESRNLLEGEDLGFIRKANELGYKFFTDYSLVCKHQKNVDLLDVNNYAIQYANRAVLKYDAHIKSQVQDAIKAAFQRGFESGHKASVQIEPAKAPQSTLWLPNS